MNGPYVRRMIPKPSDTDREVEADDQAIQTILLGLPEEIYAAVDSCETAQEIWLRVQQMMKGYDIGIQEKKAKLFNEWERFTSTDGESIESYYHRFSKLMNDSKRNKNFPENIASNLKWLKEMGGGNQFRQYAGQNVRNQNRNDNVVATRAEGNANENNGYQIRCYNCRGLGHLARNCTVRPQRRDFDLTAAAADLDEIEEVNANCILMANLQQASTSGTQTDKALVYDSDGSAEVQLYDNCYNNEIFNMFTQEEQGGTVEEHPATVEETRAYFELLYNNLEIEVEKVNTVDHKLRETNADLTTELARDFKSLANKAGESLAKHKALELEIKRLLRAVVSQDIMSIVQNNFVVDTSNLQTKLEPYNDMQQKIEQLQAQLGDPKGKSKDTPCVSDTLDPLPQKPKNKNVELEFQVSKQKDTTKGTSTNTKFANQSTKRKPSLQSLRNKFVVRQPNTFQSERLNFSKTRVPQKVDKMNDLSNPVTSNSVPTTKESKVVENDKVIAPGMFRINPFKNSREEKYVPNKPIKASVKTNQITVSQPHVITKKVVNSDSNGFSSTRVDITTKTRRPQP
ncbi:retrovirus-related pol polyprotein from transposon TNT 1-94 [Tanacetum coccineum]